MKKTISINIAGQIFYIEEDGYEKLRAYLNSIQKYFSTYEDSAEIVSDIEGRIAEKFAKSLKTNDQKAITLAEVDTLIKSMGTVADFEAMEDKAPLPNPRPDGLGETKTPAGRVGVKRLLVRDSKRKLIGGVAAGIAHYFHADPLIMRLIALCLFLGFPILGSIFGSLSGIVFLSYIAVWVSFPASSRLEEDKNVKKFYRDTDQKVLAGLAGGVSAYFGVYVGMVRLLWVLSIFLFGTGILLYFILWIITPRANTLTEKMEMTGQPITLENIETNIKQALQSDTKEENIITKLFLLPFRIAATVFKGLTPFAKFIVSIIRVFAGLVLMFVGGIAVLAVITMFLNLIGGWETITALPMPADLLLSEVSPFAYVFGLLAFGIPFAAILWVGLSLLSRQNKFSPAVWQTMLGLFLVGIIGFSVFAGKYANQFKKEGKIDETREFTLSKNTLLEVGKRDSNDYRNFGIDFNGYEGDKLKAVLHFEAQGRTKQAAERHAKTMQYSIVQKDSVLLFDENFELANNAKFRGQGLKIDLYVPYNKPFSVSKDFYNAFNWGGLQHKNYDTEKDNNETFKQIKWVMTRDSGLVCLNRVMLPDDDTDFEDEYDNNDEIGGLTNAIGADFDEDFNQSFDSKGEFLKAFDVKNFDRLSISGAYIVKIVPSEMFKVEAEGRQKDIDELEITVDNGLLKIRKDHSLRGLLDKDKRINLTISMPTVKAIELAGATKARVSGFNNLSKLNVHISGASKSLIDVVTNDLDVELTGAGQMKLNGKANNVTAKLSGACSLDAQNMNIGKAEVNASGASKASMGNIKDLKTNTSGVSKISRD